jgi:hypothetical protein
MSTIKDKWEVVRLHARNAYMGGVGVKSLILNPE